MTIAKWAVLAACFLPLITVGIAKAAHSKQPRKHGGYDNENPREWENKLTGWQARANAAQLNGFESLPLFIAGVLFAKMSGVNPSTVDILAVAFVVVRIAYIIAYIKNWSSIRSVIWTVGTGISVALLMMGT